MSIDGWLDTENVLYTTIEYYPVLKKYEIMPCASTWMNLEDVVLSKIRQSQKGRYCTVPLALSIQIDS